MPFRDMLRDKVTLVKKNGTVVREGIKAQVAAGKIITFEIDLLLEPGDHFLRTLPSGLVEDFEVVDPNFISGMGGIPSSFQAKVRRAHDAIAAKDKVVQNIVANFNGPNSRLTVGTDSSVNVSSGSISPDAVAGILGQIKSHVTGLPEPQRTQIIVLARTLEDEINSDPPDQSKLRSTLQSVKAIAEGVTGSLVATGIVGLIAQLLS